MPPRYGEDGKPIMRYRTNIIRVLNNYPTGSPSLVVAIDALITTAVEKLQERALDDVADKTCQQLHPGGPKGLICKRCFDSKELGQTSEEALLAGESSVTLPEQQENEITRQVRMLIGKEEE